MNSIERTDDDDDDNSTEPNEEDRRAAEKFLADLRAAREMRAAMDRLLGEEYSELLHALDSILDHGLEYYLRTGDENGREKIERLVLALDAVMRTWREDVMLAVKHAEAVRLPHDKEEDASVASIEFLKMCGAKMRVRINGRAVLLSRGLVPVMLALMSPGIGQGADMAPFKPSRQLEEELGFDTKRIQKWVNRLKAKLGVALGGIVESRDGGSQREYRLRVPAVIARRFLLGLKSWGQRGA